MTHFLDTMTEQLCLKQIINKSDYRLNHDKEIKLLLFFASLYDLFYHDKLAYCLIEFGPFDTIKFFNKAANEKNSLLFQDYYYHDKYFSAENLKIVQKIDDSAIEHYFINIKKEIQKKDGRNCAGILRYVPSVIVDAKNIDSHMNTLTDLTLYFDKIKLSTQLKEVSQSIQKHKL